MSEVDDYKTQRRVAAESLFAVQGPDRGWGRRPDSESSLVNTAEVLNVIKAAGLGATPGALDAAGFIVRALPVHYRPRSADVSQPARGQNLRYLSFGLDGLVTVPEVAFTQKGIEAIQFCVSNLAAVQKKGAVPPKPNAQIMSYHATSRALIAVSKLLATDGHEVLPPQLADTARNIADSAASYLVREQDDDTGAWTVEPGYGTSLSLSKSAIANTALGYYRLINDRSEFRARQKKASAWLSDNYSRWMRETSSDDQEASTDWSHLDYAECVRGLSAGRDDTWTFLKRSWTFMLGLWSKRDQLWTEPKGNATIPAAYHTVMAFESVLRRSQVVIPPQVGTDPFGNLVRVDLDGSGLMLEGSERTTVIHLSPSLDKILRVVIAAPVGLSGREIAELAGQNANVISGYVGRVNNAIREKSGGAVSDFIQADSQGREKIYRVVMRPDDA